MIHSAYIIGGVRTPIGSFGGSLSQVRADDLAAHVLRQLAAQFKELTGQSIGEVLMGCANQSGEDNRNVARMALLLAGYPFSVPGETVNRLCASGLSAVAAAARSIFSGEEQIMIAGGVEHMTRAPWVISKSSTAFGRDAQMFDSSFGWRFINPLMKQMYGIDAMGETAENLAEKYKNEGLANFMAQDVVSIEQLIAEYENYKGFGGFDAGPATLDKCLDVFLQRVETHTPYKYSKNSGL